MVQEVKSSNHDMTVVMSMTQGIRLEYTMPKTPELNGLTKRMNRTIMERVRSMLLHAALRKSYWAEAMYTDVYMINRSSSVLLKGDVPQRVWISKYISNQHLTMFGCLYVAKGQRLKLDNKSKPCIFLGYSEDEFGYRLWDILNKKMVRSRDIIFMEVRTIEHMETTEDKVVFRVDSCYCGLRTSRLYTVGK